MSQIISAKQTYPISIYPLPAARIASLEELEPYLGKVVKFTSDGGKNWQYFLLDQFVYSEDGREIRGVKCFAEKRLWKSHLVGTYALFSNDSFAKGNFSDPQS